MLLSIVAHFMYISRQETPFWMEDFKRINNSQYRNLQECSGIPLTTTLKGDENVTAKATGFPRLQ